MALSRIGSDAIADGAIQGVDIQAGAVTNTAGMIHAFDTDPSTGALTWYSDVSTLFDGNGVAIYDAVVVGTDDMTFSVNESGHLIMTIN